MSVVLCNFRQVQPFIMSTFSIVPEPTQNFTEHKPAQEALHIKESQTSTALCHFQLQCEELLLQLLAETLLFFQFFLQQSEDSVLTITIFWQHITFHSDSSDNPMATKSNLTFKNAFLSDISVNLRGDLSNQQ